VKYIKTYEGLFDKVYSNMNPINNIGGKWNKESVFGMNLNIQPSVYIKRSLVDPTLEKISKLSKRWNLVYNSVDLYRVSKDHFIKFRFSDIEGDSDYGTESGPIPIDIGEEIVLDVKRELGDFVQFEHFHNRGYIHFNVSLEMIGKRIDEGLFDLFKKKKPVRELPTEILYEPMNAIESDAFLKSHDMIDFNKEELDYLSPISKYHKLEISSTGADLFFIDTMNNEFRIYKFDDEWYLIKHKEWVKRPNGIDDDVVWKYYKCDTFDGVKQFFIKQKELGKT
jgi:hypothetical protein